MAHLAHIIVVEVHIIRRTGNAVLNIGYARDVDGGALNHGAASVGLHVNLIRSLASIRIVGSQRQQHAVLTDEQRGLDAVCAILAVLSALGIETADAVTHIIDRDNVDILREADIIELQLFGQFLKCYGVELYDCITEVHIVLHIESVSAEFHLPCLAGVVPIGVLDTDFHGHVTEISLAVDDVRRLDLPRLHTVEHHFIVMAYAGGVGTASAVGTGEGTVLGKLHKRARVRDSCMS